MDLPIGLASSLDFNYEDLVSRGRRLGLHGKQEVQPITGFWIDGFGSYGSDIWHPV